MTKLTEAQRACLQVVVAHGGRMNHDEDSLASFFDDGSTLTEPDTFNQCHDAEWLVSRYDNFLDTSFVELTPAGRLALSETKEPT